MKKRIISLLLMIVMIVSIVPSGVITMRASATNNFTPRLTAPTGGIYKGYSSNNCARYAYWRSYEILGYPIGWGETLSGQSAWDRLRGFTKSSRIPKVGALACWTGHIAVVEKVNGNQVVLSAGNSWTESSGDDDNTSVYDGIGVVGKSTKSTDRGPKYPGTWWWKVTASVDANGKPITFDTKGGKKNVGSGGWLGYIYLIDGGDIPINNNNSGGGSSSGGSNYINTSDSKQKGRYICHVSSGVNFRSGAGTQNGKIGLIGKGAIIDVTETHYNWGKCTYGGKTGWVCLDYFTYQPIVKPSSPVGLNVAATDAAQGKVIRFNWNAVSNADGYKVSVRGAETMNDIDVGNRTFYDCKLSNAGVYQIYVKAYNSAGESNYSSEYKSCVSHAPSKVTFVDWDGREIDVQNIEYGSSATAPAEAPSREGYTFNGWKGSYYNVTSDRTITATYKIITYTVYFLDRDGNTIKEQKVDYHNDATPPEDKHIPEGYEFLGWSSEAYKNVFTTASNREIYVSGIYKYGNDDLPIVCNITGVSCESEGYGVSISLQNYDKKTTNGRAIVTLKTSSGKLVAMSESEAFSIPKNGSRSQTVFIPSEQSGNKIEVIIVDSYSSGVPVSASKTFDISGQKRWTFWEEYSGGVSFIDQFKKDHPDYDVETKTQYRYKNKEFATSNTGTKSNAANEPIWNFSNKSETLLRDWSPFSWNQISGYENEYGRRDVRTQTAVYSYNYKTQWAYSRWTGLYYGARRYGPSESSISWCTNRYSQSTDWLDYPYRESGTSSTGATIYGNYWYNQNTRTVIASTNYGTQYSYRDYSYKYNFWRWPFNWTEWSDDIATETANRRVETRQVYRYNNTSQIKEDDSGKIYNLNDYVTTKVDSKFAGKQLTVFIYKFDGASDYTNEFIGQTKINSDGTYSVGSIKLREEPTIKSGDYTIAIAIEGTSDRIIVGKIEAPSPNYTVVYYDSDESKILSEQTVTEGGYAIVPQTPEKEGYDFIGWSKTNINVKENMEIYPMFVKKQFTVMFVDWTNQVIEARKFEYGDKLEAPTCPEIEGYNFEGWDAINDGTFVVTTDMVVTAEYKEKEYSVKFYDFNNNEIEPQIISYGNDAVAPPDAGESEDDKIFAGWQSDDFVDVKHDAYIYPIYYYEKTAEIPTADYESGEYDNTIKVSLSTSDETDVIYYILSDNPDEELLYKDPIVIDKTCSVTFYATGFGKNDSDTKTNYYCINNENNMTDWMLSTEVPAEVKENADRYNIETTTGYKYKDVISTSSLTELKKMVADGWTLSGYSDFVYSQWQDEPIENDTDSIDFAVEHKGEKDEENANVYRYNHYKYIDSSGNVNYAASPIDGYDCIEETVFLSLDDTTSLSMKFDSSMNPYFVDKSGINWFNKEPWNVQYRSKHKNANLYKWTDWTTDPPSDSREYVSEELTRYSNKNYHIARIYTLENEETVMLVQDGMTIDTTKVSNIYGYDYIGLYSDDERTVSFSVTAPITESVELYAKYSVHKFLVRFLMPSGFELSRQKVEYLTSAVDPGAIDVEGFIFGGWDTDFSCITENTDVVGRYYKESEYSRISLNRTTFSMFTGTYYDLVATITPNKNFDKLVEWSSSDPTVASVDSNGKVTALRAGTAVIKAKLTENNEYALCTVTVQADLYAKLFLKDGSSLNYDGNGYLRRIPLGTSVAKVKNEFINDSLEFYRVDGTKLSESDIVGTGTVIKLMDGASVADSASIIITGDIDGDGKCTLKDSTHIMQYLLETEEFAPYQIGASDVNGDGFVNNKDAALIARFVAGLDVDVING